jgi:hypothetical protein
MQDVVDLDLVPAAAEPQAKAVEVELDHGVV